MTVNNFVLVLVFARARECVRVCALVCVLVCMCVCVCVCVKDRERGRECWECYEVVQTSLCLRYEAVQTSFCLPYEVFQTSFCLPYEVVQTSFCLCYEAVQTSMHYSRRAPCPAHCPRSVRCNLTPLPLPEG